MRKLMLILIVLLIPASLLAQDEPWRTRRPADRYSDLNAFELTPFAGYRYGGTIFADTSHLFSQDVDVASAGNFGVSFAIPVGNALKIELILDRQNTHFVNGNGLFAPDQRLGGFDITYFHGGVQFPFAVSRTAQPYVSLTAGVANLDPRIEGASSANRFSAGAGIGVKVPINRNMGIKIEERGFFTSLSNYGDRCRNYSNCYYSYNHDLYQGETNVGVFFRF